MGYILVSRLQPQNSKIQSMLDIQEGTDVVTKIRNNIINQYVQNGAFYSTIININHYSTLYYGIIGDITLLCGTTLSHFCLIALVLHVEITNQHIASLMPVT